MTKDYINEFVSLTLLLLIVKMKLNPLDQLFVHKEGDKTYAYKDKYAYECTDDFTV